MSKKPRDPKRRQSADDQGSSGDESRYQRPRDRFPSLPDEPTPPPRRSRRAPVSEKRSDASDGTRNLIALFFLLLTFAALAYFVVIWQDPYSPLNPLSPPTPLPLMITATPTPAPTSTPAPTNTPAPTRTPTDVPTAEPTLTFTPVFLEALVTPGATLDAGDSANYRFDLQTGRAIYLTNPSARAGCNWSSIAGSVMSYEGTAIRGYGVRIAGEGVDETIGTGTAPGFGPGGFELPLGNVARDATFVAQLLDPQGTPVSPVYTVETRSECDFNIAALRFVETEPSS